MRDEKRCPVCDRELPVTDRGRPRRYCSRACQARAYRQRRQRAARPEPVSPRSPRHRQIVEAVWRIAADRGLHAASTREVAAEAGVSPRVVQYHFASKHQLLVAALELLNEDNERRARARMPRGPLPPKTLLRRILAEFLPLDEQRRASLRVLAAYYARSLTDPVLAAVFLHADQPLERLVAGVIRQAQRDGLAAPRPHPGPEADLLVSGVTGLALDVLHGRRTLGSVQRVLDYHLDRLFPS